MFFADRVKETSITTGTGDFTLLGAIAGFEAFSTNFATNEKLYYVIAGGTSWEIGIGHLSGSTTLVRDQILQSTNSDAAVSFAAGTKIVFCDLPSFHANSTTTYGLAIALASVSYIR